MKYERVAWAFLRTMCRDYRAGCPRLWNGRLGEYPWRRCGPNYAPYMKGFLLDPNLPQRVILYETRKEASADAKAKGERGRPVRVRVTVRTERWSAEERK